MDLYYSDGIAGSRTMLAVTANPAAIQARLPAGWILEPYSGDDLRGRSLRGANVLVPFHRVYANDGQSDGMQQLSYVAFVSQAREVSTNELAHIHWFAYTEDPEAVPGRYHDAKLAHIKRFETFTQTQRGRTDVHEMFYAAADDGLVHLSLGYQAGDTNMWVTAEEPNLRLIAARDPRVDRWYQEDQVLDVVRSQPLGIDRAFEANLIVQGELATVFDRSSRVIAVVIQKPYVRRVWEPISVD